MTLACDERGSNAGLAGYILVDVLEAFWDEVLYDTPLAIVTFVTLPFLTFLGSDLWKTPGWRGKGLAMTILIVRACCCAHAWGQATLAWLGPTCTPTPVMRRNTVMHMWTFLHSRAASAAGMFGKGHSVNTPSRGQFEGSSSPSPWSWLKRVSSCNKQDAVAIFPEDVAAVPEDVAAVPVDVAAVPEDVAGGLQPGTDAKHMPPDIKPPVREEQPSSRVMHLAAGPQAPPAAHLAAAKQGLAAQLGNDAPSDLLKAHRGVLSDAAAEPNQPAQGGAKANKRTRRAVKRAAERAAKAAAAALQGKADEAPGMPTVREQGDQAVKGEAAKAATPPSLTLDEPGAPPTPTSQAAVAGRAVHADTAAPVDGHKQDTHPTRKHGTGMLMMSCVL